jgi:thymidine kinase
MKQSLFNTKTIRQDILNDIDKKRKKLMSQSRIELIIGCMFSGKTLELMRRVSRYEAIGKQCLIINHNNDTRTGDSIKTHSDLKRKSIKTDSLFKLNEDFTLEDIDVIAIDEAQFFPDLRRWVEEMEKTGKILIISGLDGDYLRKPIGQILDCIPLCDTVDKLTAMDMVDRDGTKGLFTKRIVDNDDPVLIGDTDFYMAVSRGNYLY